MCVLQCADNECAICVKGHGNCSCRLGEAMSYHNTISMEKPYSYGVTTPCFLCL